MDLNKCKVLSTSDFCSTFQGLDDKYSDVDEFSIILQPLYNSVFQNLKDGSKHVDEHRYYSLERFINLSLKGSFDSLLLLASQLVNCRYTSINQSIFKDFYCDDHLFSDLVYSRQKTYANSLMGIINQSINQQDKKHDEYGKVMVKKVAFMNRLHSFIKSLENDDVFDFNTFIKPDVNLNMLHVDDVLPYKRYTYAGWFSDDKTIGLYYKIEKDVRTIEKLYHSTKLADSEFEYENKLKSKVLDYIVRHGDTSI